MPQSEDKDLPIKIFNLSLELYELSISTIYRHFISNYFLEVGKMVHNRMVL